MHLPAAARVRSCARHACGAPPPCSWHASPRAAPPPLAAPGRYGDGRGPEDELGHKVPLRRRVLHVPHPQGAGGRVVGVGAHGGRGLENVRGAQVIAWWVVAGARRWLESKLAAQAQGAAPAAASAATRRPGRDRACAAAAAGHPATRPLAQSPTHAPARLPAGPSTHAPPPRPARPRPQAVLERNDRSKKIRFVDISDMDYDPMANMGVVGGRRRGAHGTRTPAAPCSRRWATTGQPSGCTPRGPQAARFPRD